VNLHLARRRRLRTRTRFEFLVDEPGFRALRARPRGGFIEKAHTDRFLPVENQLSDFTAVIGDQNGQLFPLKTVLESLKHEGDLLGTELKLGENPLGDVRAGGVKRFLNVASGLNARGVRRVSEKGSDQCGSQRYFHRSSFGSRHLSRLITHIW